jgi:hypothetical protein
MSDTESLPEKKTWQPPTIQDFEIEEQTRSGVSGPTTGDGVTIYS